MRLLPRLCAALAAISGLASGARGQAVVEYPAHPATHGDHVIAASWPGGPTSVQVVFESDEAVLHGDGIGQSQRTARNTLTFTPPASPSNPQDYDEPRLVTRYGARLPLLQQMSANGVSTLRYELASAVSTGLDLFVTDVDSGDSVSVRAFGEAAEPLPASVWSLVLGGDLSEFKNTGTGFSSIVAPPPATSTTGDVFVLRASDSTNYNRSFTVLRVGPGVGIRRVEVRFRGLQNSASRADAGTGAHVYLGLATTPPLADVGAGARTRFELAVPSPARASIEWTLRVDDPARVRLTLHDITGRRAGLLDERELVAGVHTGSLATTHLAPGLYWLRAETPDGTFQRRVVVIR